MKIRIPSMQELNPGHPKHDGDPSHPMINGLLPTLADCEIVDDNGKVITTEVEAIDIRMRCGEPIVATVRRYDVHCEIHAGAVVEKESEQIDLLLTALAGERAQVQRLEMALRSAASSAWIGEQALAALRTVARALGIECSDTEIVSTRQLLNRIAEIGAP